MKSLLPEKLVNAALILLSAAWLPHAADKCDPVKGTVAIENASVITMIDSTIHSDFTIISDGATISWVGPSRKACVAKTTQRINARGKFVVPGLADMHVHMDAGDTLLYIANGVTQVREMNGTPALIALRDAVRSGNTLGPMMSVSGPLTAGTRQQWRHVLVETPDSARRLVQAEKAQGYDAIKVYDGLSMPTYRAMADEAAKLHIPLVGHIPRDVGIDSVLALHQRSLEHGDQIIGAASHAPRSADDSIAIAGTARKIARSGSWVTPTIAAEYALNILGTTGYAQQLDRPEMKFQDSATLAWWKSLAAPRAGTELSTDEFRSASSRQYFGFKQQLVRELDRAGVKMLAGTDTPNPLMVPGFSLVDELVILNRAGLSPYRVLRMATSDASDFINGNFGRVRRGDRADLLVLDENPLRDLTTLRKPQAVMVRGKWFDRAALAGMLAARKATTDR